MNPWTRHLKEEYAQKGIDIAVYVYANISVNGRPYQKFINPDIDIAALEWETFKHSDWILPSKLD